MKRELRFFSRYVIQYFGICAGLTAALVFGVLALHSGDNLLGTYVSMYPVFGFLFSFVYATVARPYLNMAIGFGAGRMACFAAAEITYTAFAAGMVLLTKLVSVCTASVEGLRMGPVSVSGTQMLLMLLISLCLVQAGFLMGCILDVKKRSVVMVILMIVIMAFAFGISFALFSNMDEQTGIDALTVSLKNPLWQGILAGTAVLDILLTLVTGRQFRKAVYCIG